MCRPVSEERQVMAYDREYYLTHLQERKEYYEQNRERIAQYCREYYFLHRDAIKARITQWKKDHATRIREQEKDRYKNDPEAFDRRTREWQVSHKDKVRETQRAWKKANPDRVRAKNQSRRARKTGAAADLTVAQWNEILVMHDYRCRYCGAKFSREFPATQDHVIPLSKGGHHTSANVVPACRSCNSRKGARLISA